MTATYCLHGSVSPRAAIAFGPRNLIAHSNLGNAFRVKGEHGRTNTDLGVAIRHNPKIADDVRGFALQELET